MGWLKYYLHFIVEIHMMRGLQQALYLKVLGITAALWSEVLTPETFCFSPHLIITYLRKENRKYFPETITSDNYYLITVMQISSCII